MIVLDASVLIGHFESADAHHNRATRLMATHAGQNFAASVVTIAELYVGATRAGQAEQLSRLLRRLNVVSLELPADAARRLGELRCQTRLKMPDCAVLFAAESRGAELATFDRILAARAREIGVTVTDAQD
ncbi:type II toxin-antitoxin system VapC family toxin [Mycolicibacterium brumae]|uniref:Ribonuclease VapC n=1 Tax=Mycolicibacterium brumae TaxID=85968 RepID=A0A2G5P7N2_9MYCO|nr:PIN domain-containing protein [Mycolicibacterium brumae]MCV7194725.1 PIN domain-containing protein [Mycolicibacterium brumae]PIB74276.1 PIN domain-containing protein [Mycolicibacterium brumae]RWA15173.1 hypothetical protein MBRU_11180 [Mycolicibacterium brumae DSM 44177]UWW08241.1 PIN domain-containing protein [Mycolicibacterium brumae]